MTTASTKLVTYDPKKDIPIPRSGARGFTASTGSVFLDPNVPTPISDELLKELDSDATFKALKESGAITISTLQLAVGVATTSQPQDQVFNLPVSETESPTEAKKTTK